MKAWEYCATCDTDLREWFHTEGCPELRARLEADHREALRLHCRECGSLRNSGVHRTDCETHRRYCERLTANTRAANAWHAANPHELWRPTASRGRGWSGWLGGCREHGYAHGSELRPLLESFGEGSLSEDADDCLRWGTDAALIRREAEPTPTPQQFHLARRPPAPSWFGYAPGGEP